MAVDPLTPVRHPIIAHAMVSSITIAQLDRLFRTLRRPPTPEAENRALDLFHAVLSASMGGPLHTIAVYADIQYGDLIAAGMQQMLIRTLLSVISVRWGPPLSREQLSFEAMQIWCTVITACDLPRAIA